jgi:hypothetical protein
MVLRGALSFLVLAGVIVACGGSEKTEKICTPDANVFCRCEDRKEGTKKCKADGNTFEACKPCDGSGDPGPGAGAANPLGAAEDRSSSDTTTKTSTSGDDDDDSSKSSPSKPPLPSGSSTDPSKPTTDPSKTSTDPSKPSTPTKDDPTPTPVPPKKSDTSKPDTSSFPDTPHCKPLTNGAPKIETQDLADTAASAKGGDAQDGLYYQAWAINFTGDSGASGPTKKFSKMSLELMGDVGRYVFEDEDGKNTAGGFRLSKVSGKNKVSIEYECPAGPPKEMAYDATDSTLVLYDGTYARVFYKQAKGAK